MKTAYCTLVGENLFVSVYQMSEFYDEFYRRLLFELKRHAPPLF
jgi:hypothetical protein